VGHPTPGVRTAHVTNSLTGPQVDDRGEKEVDAMQRPFERLLSQGEAADLLGIHPETLRRMSIRGEIPALKVGRFWKYRGSALDEWVSSRLNCRGLSCREKVDP
jgi:excisionase family DNA binding protein